MSRKSVRQAVAAFLQPPNVTGIGVVYTAKPREVEADNYRFGLPTGSQSGAIAYPIILREREGFFEIKGSPSSGKIIEYRVQIALRFHSNQQVAQDAQDDYDDMVDSLKTRIRSDAYLGTLGSANPIWFSTKEAFGTMDMEHRCDPPYPLQRGGGTLIIWGTLEFDVAEAI